MINLENKPGEKTHHKILHKLTVESIHSHHFFPLLSLFCMVIIYLFLLEIYAVIKKKYYS